MTIVFVHGAGLTGEVWEPQRAHFATALAPSLPGRPAGLPLTGEASIASYARAIVSLLDDRGIERALLAGSSMGGAVALQCALDAPARVAGLALLGSGARLRVAPAIIEGVQHAFDVTVDTLVKAFFAEPNAERDAALRDIMRAVGSQTAARDFIACDAFDASTRLGEVNVPALVVVGDADRLTPPKYAEFLTAGLAHARLAVLPGVGHLPALEAPHATNELLHAFAAQLMRGDLDPIG